MWELLGDSIIWIILILLCVLLICREIVAWYLKINVLVKQQDEQIELLRDIVETMHERLYIPLVENKEESLKKTQN